MIALSSRISRIGFLLLVLPTVIAGICRADDARSTANDLGSQPVVTPVAEAIAPANDQDYFKFTAAGNYTAIIDATFLHADGDIDIQLQDASGDLANPGAQLAISQSSSDNEQIRFPVTAGTEYYIRVFGFNGATNPSYALGLSTTTVVNNTLGGRGDGSLHDAIGGADALSGQFGANYDVTFNGVFGSIVLTAPISPISNQVSIIGPGKTNMSIDGNGQNRHLIIGSGAVVSISGLKFINGDAAVLAPADTSGGSILNLGTLDVSDSDFVGNKAIDAIGFGAGGAIASFGPLTLTRSDFLQNLADLASYGAGSDGGAITASSDLTAIDCRFIGNATADGINGISIAGNGAEGGFGGAILIAFSDLTLRRCVFDSNRTGSGGDAPDGDLAHPDGFPGGDGGRGSAIHMLAGNYVIEECGFYRNSTGNGGAGGLAAAGGIDGSAGSGGDSAIYFIPAGPTTVATMRNCTISENTAGAPGLAGPSPAMESASAVAIISTSYVSVSPAILHCTIANNRGPGTQNAGAAVVVSNVDPLEMEGCILHGNTVDDSGTIRQADLRGDTVYLGTNIVGAQLFGAAVGPAPLNLDPLLAPLAANGGPGETQIPMQGSPAIDNALNGTNTPATDGRLFLRPYGLAPDIGAVETRRLVVNTTVDENDGINNNGVSLRDAIGVFVHAGAPEEGVAFDPAVFPPGLETSIEITNGPIVIGGSNAGLIVDGTGHVLPDGNPGIIIDGLDSTHLLEIAAAGDGSFKNVWFRGGASSTAGGGIWNAGTLRLNQCHITNCLTLDGKDEIPGQAATSGANGGAIYSTGTLFLTDCLVADNRTGDGGNADPLGAAFGREGGDGGAVYCTSAELVRSRFVGNRTGASGESGKDELGGLGGNGGAVFSSDLLIVEACEFFENQTGRGGKGGSRITGAGLSGGSGGNGGAISFFGGTIRASLFRENRTGSGGDGGDGINPGSGGGGGTGGAIIAVSITPITFENCTVFSNHTGMGGAEGNGGATTLVKGPHGGIDVTAQISPIVIRHCTISSNSGREAGGIGSGNGLAQETIENSIVFGNFDENGAASDVVSDFNVEGVNLIGVASGGALSGSGTVSNADPLLAPFGDYGGPLPCFFPYPSSPAVNTAIPTAGSPGFDQRGHYRPVGSAPDIGAVESDVGLIITDSDADGMDDFWEALYGLVVGVNDADGDGDGDLSSNADEFRNHTNPRDPASVFKITAFIGAGVNPIGHPQFEVRWSSWLGLSYQTEISQTLTGWNPDQNLNGAAVSLETGTIVVMPQPVHFVHVVGPP